MATSVLNTTSAVEASVLVVRTFVKLRQMLASHIEMRHKLLELEKRLDSHDESIHSLIAAIHQLMEPSEPKRKHSIGFAPWPPEVKNNL